MKNESIGGMSSKQRQAHEGIPLTEKQKRAHTGGDDSGYDFSFGDALPSEDDEVSERGPEETLQ